MATSGSFTTSNTAGIGANYPKNATYSWWQNSQSVSGNYTDIGWQLVLGGGASNNYYISVYGGDVTTDGSSTSFNMNGASKYNGAVLASGTKRIWHSGDGSKWFGASASVNIFASANMTVSGSGGWWLNTIPRKVNINNVTGSYTDENFTPTVSWSNNGNRVDLKLELPDFGITEYKRWTWLNDRSSYAPRLSQGEINNILAKIPNQSTCKIRFTIVTVINGKDAFYDYIDRTFSVVHAYPSMTRNFWWWDGWTQSADVMKPDTAMIQGESILQVQVNSTIASARKYASLSSIVVSCGGKSVSIAPFSSPEYKVVDLGRIDASTTQTLTVKAIDSRGNYNSESKSVPFVAYRRPSISISASRKNNFENETTVSISGSYTTLSGKNTINATNGVQYRYRESGGSWSAWKAVSVTFNNGKFNASAFKMNLNNSVAFEFEAQVTDRLNNVHTTTRVDRGTPIFRISTSDSKCYNNEKRVLVAGDNISDLTNNKNFSDGYRLRAKDERDHNYYPSHYWDGGMGITAEFKRQSTVGADNKHWGTYSQLVTFTPWGDPSGEEPMQLLMAGSYHDDNPILVRNSVSGSWGRWRRVMDEGASKDFYRVHRNVAMGYGSSMTIYRSMNVVTTNCEIHFTGNVGGSWAKLGEKMPTGYRPCDDNIVIRANKVLMHGCVQWKVYPNGDMYILRQGDANANAYFHISATWFTADSMP